MNAKERFAARKVQTTNETATEVVETETVEYDKAQVITIDERFDAVGNKRAQAHATFGDIKVWFYAPQTVLDGVEDGEVLDFVFDDADEMTQRKTSGHWAYNYVVGAEDSPKSEQILTVITVPEDVDVDSVHLTF